MMTMTLTMTQSFSNASTIDHSGARKKTKNPPVGATPLVPGLPGMTKGSGKKISDAAFKRYSDGILIEF
jgi:hypothetical protein